MKQTSIIAKNFFYYYVVLIIKIVYTFINKFMLQVNSCFLKLAYKFSYSLI